MEFREGLFSILGFWVQDERSELLGVHGTFAPRGPSTQNAKELLPSPRSRVQGIKLNSYRCLNN